jgi:hypothetical protein
MQAETIQRLYGLVEAKVLARSGNRTDREYLALLGDGLPALRKQYFASNVAVNYASADAIDRYLLAYFPHYVYTASVALSHIPCDQLLAGLVRGLDVVCVGSGPLPELIALIDRLLECGAQAGQITLTAVDVNTTAWATAMQDSIAIANQLAPHLNVSLLTEQRDCTAPVTPGQPPLPNCDVLLIQNCLNEIGHARCFPEHAMQFVSAVRQGGYLIVSDLIEYQAVSNAIPDFDALAQGAGYQVVSHFDSGAPAVRSPFAQNVPARTYFGFFGFYRDSETGERQFPEWRRPKAWIRFSTVAWQRS